MCLSALNWGATLQTDGCHLQSVGGISLLGFCFQCVCRMHREQTGMEDGREKIRNSARRELKIWADARLKGNFP